MSSGDSEGHLGMATWYLLLNNLRSHSNERPINFQISTRSTVQSLWGGLVMYTFSIVCTLNLFFFCGILWGATLQTSHIFIYPMIYCTRLQELGTVPY